jgi:hypothetical protein
MILMDRYPLQLLSENNAESIELIVDNARRPFESKTEAKLARDRATRSRVRSRSLSNDRASRRSSRNRSKSLLTSCRWESEKHPSAIPCLGAPEAADGWNFLRQIPRMPVRQLSSRFRTPERQASKGNIFSDTVGMAINTLRMPIRQLSKKKVDSNLDVERAGVAECFPEPLASPV